MIHNVMNLSYICIHISLSCVYIIFNYILCIMNLSYTCTHIYLLYVCIYLSVYTMYPKVHDT